MNEAPSEVKAPPMREHSTDDDWREHLYNQERLLSSLDKISDDLNGLLDTQRQMTEFALKLNANMDTLDETLKNSSKTMSGFVTNIAKIPIVIVLVGLASWGFYIERLSEKGWIVVVLIASFPYLGDGIMAILKIVRGGEAK